MPPTTRISQITADLGPDVDALGRLAERLAAASVGVRALALEGLRLRLVVDDPDRALGALGEAGVEAWLGDAVAVELEDRPGAVEEILSRLQEARLEVQAAYTGASRTGGRTRLVLTCPDVDAVSRLLEDA